MNKIIDKYLNNLNESWSWLPSTLFIHKLINNDDIVVEERLKFLVKLKVLSDIKNVYLYSFLYPDVEYVFSVCTDLIKGPTRKRAFNSYTDPKKIMINKRMTITGFSLERISNDIMKTNYFLGLGRSCTFKKIAEIKSESISTNIPIPFGVGAAWWSNVKSNLETPNILNCGFFQAKQTKIFLVPQALLKTNYIYAYNIVTESKPRRRFFSGEM